MNQRELDLLQAVVFEVTETAVVHPHMDANELAMMICNRPNASEMMVVQAISALASRVSEETRTTIPTTEASQHASMLPK